MAKVSFFPLSPWKLVGRVIRKAVGAAFNNPAYERSEALPNLHQSELPAAVLNHIVEEGSDHLILCPALFANKSYNC